jgi:anti-sigma factor RsiW
MPCDVSHDRLSAYLDGELAPDEQRVVAQHLETCHACQTVLADHQRMGRRLRQEGRTVAPAGLDARIRASIDRAAMADGAPRGPSDGEIAPRARPSIEGRLAAVTGYGRLARQAAAFAATCLISIAATYGVMQSSEDRGRTEREVLNAHVRSLLQDTPVQIASSDQHTVKPWFAGRADFAPSIRDLAGDGFPLLGGRLDYVVDRRVAAAVYKRNLHIVNVFIWPATGDASDSAPALTQRNGYNLLTWKRNGMTYWAVTDLNAIELGLLQRLL